MLRRSTISFASSALLRRSAPAFTATTRAAAATAATATPLLHAARRGVTEVHHTNQFEAPSRRDQESFLSQYCPLEQLGLEEGESSLANIKAAYEASRAKYKGNKGQIDRIERAYNILTDPQSPYYERAGWQQQYRTKLKVDLLPTPARRQVQGYIGFFSALGIFLSVVMLYSFTFPLFKIHRAATR